MKTNTKRPAASIGEQWLPVPVRLVNAITDAPTAKRRLWATAYLVVWVLVFCRMRRDGCSPTLGDLEAWSTSKARHRTMKAKTDALACLSAWNGEEKRTDFEPETNCKRTEGKQEDAGDSDTNELQANRERTAHAGARSTDTDLQGTENTPYSPPAGDAVGKPVDAVDKPKRKRSRSMSLEEIAAVEIPATLQRLPGWSAAWVGYTEHRQELKAGKWAAPKQVTRLLADLEREHGKGNDVVEALHKSTASGYQGVFPKPSTGASPLQLLNGGKGEVWTGDRAWTLMVRSTLDVQSINAPGPDRWQMAPDTPGLDAAILATLQEVTQTSSGGFAWGDLRRRRDAWEQRDLERRFIKAFGAHWQRIQQEVAA